MSRVQLGEAKVRVSRRRAYRDAFRRYRIVIDGQTASVIRMGTTKQVAVNPGDHVVQLRLDRGGSAEVELSLAPDETATFACGPGSWADITERDKWILLERTD